MLDVSIIIVNWNTGKYLLDCVESIQTHTRELKYEILVVDNNSSDESIQLLDKTQFSNLTILRLQNNIGFSRANNIGVNKSKGKYLLFLNPDIIVTPDFVSNILTSYNELSKNSNVGILVPQLLNPDGSIQPSIQNFPILTLQNVFRKTRRLFKSDHVSLVTPTQIDWARGACFLIERAVGETLGFWDESYFLYSEDLELCHRYKKKGYSVMFDPTLQIFHHHNVSGNKAYSNIKESLLVKEKALFKFYLQNIGIGRYIAFILSLTIYSYLLCLKQRGFTEKELLKCKISVYLIMIREAMLTLVNKRHGMNHNL